MLHDSFHRQRLLEATMGTSASSSSVHDDAAYMTALANLRHREAMLNLVRDVSEAKGVSTQAVFHQVFPAGCLEVSPSLLPLYLLFIILLTGSAT